MKIKAEPPEKYLTFGDLAPGDTFRFYDDESAELAKIKLAPFDAYTRAGERTKHEAYAYLGDGDVYPGPANSMDAQLVYRVHGAFVEG